MKLLIHDLDDKEWEKTVGNYAGWKVIADNGAIKPCVGCFGCWVRTPGACVIKDGFACMGALIHEAEEVVVISKYTYGGFSSFVKNVFDRSIGWVLPFFEIYEGEMHHKRRYPEKKMFSFIFRGHNLTDDDKSRAKRYVEAVCRIFRSTIKTITFEECENDSGEQHILEAVSRTAEDRTILLNCSMRGNNANTKKFLDRLALDIDGEKEIINLTSYTERSETLIDNLLQAERVVFGMPLYVDGIPASALRIMEALEKQGQAGKKIIYVVTNMGFYESRQLRNLLGQAKSWCDVCGYTYGGAAAIGAGEMIGMMAAAKDPNKTPAKNAAVALKKLSEAINTSSSIEDIYADPWIFPRRLYMLAANLSWPRAGKSNGLKKKDLYAQIEWQAGGTD